MKSIINWLDFTEENLKNYYKDIVDYCSTNHDLYYSVHILVIAKENKTKRSNKFKYIRGDYKLMCSEMLIHYNEQIQNISFWSQNISSFNIIKFVPMEETIPNELIINN